MLVNKCGCYSGVICQNRKRRTKEKEKRPQVVLQVSHIKKIGTTFRIQNGKNYEAIEKGALVWGLSFGPLPCKTQTFALNSLMHI